MHRDLTKRFISDQFTPRLKDIRTDVSSPGWTFGMGAVTVVYEVCEPVLADPPKLVLDNPLAIVREVTEPGLESWLGFPDIPDVRVGLVGVFLGFSGGGDEHQQVTIRAARVRSPLAVDAGDGEISREFDLSNIPNSRVQAFGGSISIDVGEEARRFDGVISSTRLGEVVRGGH